MKTLTFSCALLLLLIIYTNLPFSVSFDLNDADNELIEIKTESLELTEIKNESLGLTEINYSPKKISENLNNECATISFWELLGYVALNYLILGIFATIADGCFSCFAGSYIKSQIMSV